MGYNTVYQVIQIDVKFSFKGVCSGIVRGSGWQTVGVVINFISYCCCGLPLGVVLMFLVFHDVTGSKHESVFFFLHRIIGAVKYLLTDASLKRRTQNSCPTFGFSHSLYLGFPIRNRKHVLFFVKFM